MTQTSETIWPIVAQKWREIAERIAEHGLMGNGLCFEVQSLSGSWTVGWLMYRQLRAHVDDHSYRVLDWRRVSHAYEDCEHDGTWMSLCYLDKPGRVEARVLFCLLLAHEAEDWTA